MHPREDQHATEHGLKRWNVEIAPIREGLRLDNLDLDAFEIEGRRGIDVRDNDVDNFLWDVFPQFRTPHVELALDRSSDRLDRRRGGNDPGLGKRRLDRPKTKIVIRIAMAKIDSTERLARRLNRIGKGASVGQNSPTVDEQRLSGASQQHRCAEEAVQVCGEMLPSEPGRNGHKSPPLGTSGQARTSTTARITCR